MRCDGEAYTVVAIEQSHVTLRSQHGQTWVADVRLVLSRGTVVPPAGAPEPPDAIGLVVSNLSRR